MSKQIYNNALLGYNDGFPIYLSAPSWDCGWYWGWGYLGNKDTHYHINGLGKDKNLYDGIKEHFGDSLKIRESDIWTFAELLQTFYLLKDTTEVLGRGGGHLTTNPCAEIIKNTEEVKRINEVVLPEIFKETYKLLKRNNNNEKLYNQLALIDLQGLTETSYQFMVDNDLKPEDIKNTCGFSQDDYSRLHSKYWKEYHEKNRDTKSNNP